MELTIKNEAASLPLKLEVALECNTSAEDIRRNVLVNSRRIKKWVKQEGPNGKTLLVCGSGPSISRHLDEIAAMQAAGAEVWALNNCANFLWGNQILADAQVIMDAQPRTAELVGPALRHLFASQVDPVVFQSEPDAILWHATYGELAVDETPGFPVHDDAYSIIGGSVSVGNTALALAYTMGYRDIHIFGMDSSNSGEKAHAMHQAINDGDPMTVVNFAGREFVASLTMREQACAFIPRAKMLIDAGCELTVHGDGLLPAMFEAFKNPTESNKYSLLWSLSAYRAWSPGEWSADAFMAIAKPAGSVIDFGCGTGRAGIRFAVAGLDVHLVDFTSNSRDLKAQGLPFTQHDLTKQLDLRADYGYCTDVMEHIPPGDVDSVLDNILACCPRVFWQISTVDDAMGSLIGQKLHLTVENHAWWRQKFTARGLTIEFEHESPSESQFYTCRKD